MLGCGVEGHFAAVPSFHTRPRGQRSRGRHDRRAASGDVQEPVREPVRCSVIRWQRQGQVKTQRTRRSIPFHFHMLSFSSSLQGGPYLPVVRFIKRMLNRLMSSCIASSCELSSALVTYFLNSKHCPYLHHSDPAFLQTRHEILLDQVIPQLIDDPNLGLARSECVDGFHQRLHRVGYVHAIRNQNCIWRHVWPQRRDIRTPMKTIKVRFCALW